MEIAVHRAADQLAGPAVSGWDLVHSNELRPELLAMSNVWQPGSEGEPLVAAAKGAPEAIARLCRLDAATRDKLDAAAAAMASRGMRVLGVASAQVAPDKATSEHLEHDFVFTGLVGLSDPLRPEVGDAVAQCRSAGIRVVMITGDYAATAQAIAADAGFAEGDTLTGDMLEAMTDAQLAQRIATVTIFARTMPEQKLRIVAALKAAGEVVAMTGDGVNDAPALKSAHIGISMGKRGTDVAREAASLVLVDDDFGAIVSAIRLGRRIYDNIRKAMGFIFGVHVPIAGLAVLPLVLDLPILLGPIQIALLEMIIDPVCALVFEAEREERNLMQRPPRSPGERLFTVALVGRAVLQGGLAFVVLASIAIAGHRLGLPPGELRTLLFFALVASVLALVLAHRSYSVAISHALIRHNVTFRYVLAAVVGASALILGLSPLQHALGFAPLGWPELALVAATGGVLLLAFELIKGVVPTPAK
jgi:Ca2+-transporting ATPase